MPATGSTPCTPVRQDGKLKFENRTAASEVWAFGTNGRFHFPPREAMGTKLPSRQRRLLILLNNYLPT